MAGDDILLDVIQRCVLPALQDALLQAGIADAAALMASLFGDTGRIDAQAVLRQQTTLQLFMPLGHAILAAWEQCDPRRSAGRAARQLRRTAQPAADRQCG
ncbi:Uncharacterized protein conserved in bacteria, putative virulence factor [Pluralibacter gergoviae]|nr:Uncharacterized protein conserved in bacteria, putative virulence factor [Pluralibacter gergoviae]